LVILYRALETVATDFSEPSNMSDKKTKSNYFVFNMIIQFFVETLVAMVIGYFIGKYLDEKLFPDKSILVYIFIIFGIFAGLSNLIKRALSFSKGDSDEENKPN